MTILVPLAEPPVPIALFVKIIFLNTTVFVLKNVLRERCLLVYFTQVDIVFHANLHVLNANGGLQHAPFVRLDTFFPYTDIAFRVILRVFPVPENLMFVQAAILLLF